MSKTYMFERYSTAEEALKALKNERRIWLGIVTEKMLGEIEDGLRLIVLFDAAEPLTYMAVTGQGADAIALEWECPNYVSSFVFNNSSARFSRGDRSIVSKNIPKDMLRLARRAKKLLIKATKANL
jgi:hypothetical protein